MITFQSARLPMVALLLALWHASLCPPAVALVVALPLSNDNTTAPIDDPGWLNVGDNGVYLGNRWVITAAHVGAQTATFPERGTFDVMPGSPAQLQNPSGSGLSAYTDLLMYRLTADPGLPSLAIAISTPAQGDTIAFIGDGSTVTTAATETQWDANWNVVSSGGVHSGYKSTTNRKLWGTNLVEDDGAVVVNDGIADVISFFTKFDKSGINGSTATGSEAQAQSGDSGSAAFDKVGGLWVLAGVTFAVGAADKLQPDPAQNAVYGNETFAADLSQYRDQILATIPEPSSLALVGAVAAFAGGRNIGALRRRRKLLNAN
jgi:Trypsin